MDRLLRVIRDGKSVVPSSEDLETVGNVVFNSDDPLDNSIGSDTCVCAVFWLMI